MRKFLIRLFLFTVIAAAINLMLFLAFDSIYLEEYREEPSSYTAFLFADSHGLPIGGHLEASGVFNFSAGSDSYTDMKRKLTHLIDNGRVEMVFLQVEGQVLSNFRNGSNNGDRSVMYSSMSDFDNFYRYVKEAWIRYYAVLLNPKSQSLFRYYIRSRFLTISRVEENHEHVDSAWEKAGEDVREREAAARAKQFYGGGLSEEQVRAFREIVDISRKNRIRLIGIKFPLPDEMMNALQDTAGVVVHENYRAANRLFYGSGVEIWDYRNVYHGLPDLFRDEDHLNSKGGVLLADTLAARISNLDAGLK